MTDPILLSELKRVYRDRATGSPLLAQRQITHARWFDDFDAFAAHFVASQPYPRPQASKYETFAWAPTLFAGFGMAEGPPEAERRPGTLGVRRGAYAYPAVSLFVADLDNSDPTAPKLDVGAFLAGFPHACLTYPSYSSREDHPKFRVIAPIARHVTHDEAARIAAVVDATSAGGQLDPAIYDPGDHLYGPPHGAGVARHLGGRPVLDPDALLAGYESLADAAKAKFRRAVGARARRALTRTERINAERRIGDTGVRPWIDLGCSLVVDRGLIDAYQGAAGGRGHWPVMRSFLCSCWTRSRDGLTLGEMLRLAGLLDERAAEPGYMRRKYGLGGIERLAVWAMSLPTGPTPTHAGKGEDADGAA